MSYDPELDTSTELDPDATSYYLTIIDILKPGRIDIITNVSLFSSHVALHREGHLNAAVHAMAHVGQRYNSRLMYHLFYLEIDYNILKKQMYLVRVL